MSYKLTIAILTYNRKDSLMKCIESIIHQIDGKPVNILISDNASTDGTSEYAQHLARQYSYVDYSCNKENVDIYGNIEQCFQKAKGEYVWTMSDDDEIEPGTIDVVLSDLEYNPIFLFLHPSSMYRLYTRKVTDTLYLYNDKNDFIRDVGIYISFISAMIYRTIDVKKIDVKKYWGCLHIHQYALEVLQNDGEIMIESFDIVKASINKKLRYDVYKVWVYEYGDILIRVGQACGFDKEILEEQVKYDLKRMILKMVIKFRYTCDKSDEWEKGYIKKGLVYCPEYFKIYEFITECPKWILPVMLRFINVISFMKRRIQGCARFKD